VAVNCAAIPRELFESEFFGHVRGAFSGASRNREGRFQLAHRGTLFLDEVGEIPYELQGKLLRVLQERAFEPVGDDRTRHVDVRVVAATNRDLDVEVERGRFRLDLFYRLSVFPLEIPPLRERREEIVPLARQFLRAAAQKLNASPPPLSAADEHALLEYDFPGNIRELQNAIERAVVLQRSEGGALELQLSLRRRPRADSGTRDVAIPAVASAEASPALGVMPVTRLRELARSNVVAALDCCAWRIAGDHGAAKLLGLKPSTLAYQMKVLGITRHAAPDSQKAESTAQETMTRGIR
jgi:transcriptional regulator with GAF, ATPase, and Fis domain